MRIELLKNRKYCYFIFKIIPHNKNGDRLISLLVTLLAIVTLLPIVGLILFHLYIYVSFKFS